MVDLWTSKYAPQDGATYFYHSGWSRIDLPLCIRPMYPSFRDIQVVPFGYLDHLCLIVSYNGTIGKHLVKSSYWQMNEVHLQNPDYDLLVRNIFQNYGVSKWDTAHPSRIWFKHKKLSRFIFHKWLLVTKK